VAEVVVRFFFLPHPPQGRGQQGDGEFTRAGVCMPISPPRAADNVAPRNSDELTKASHIAYHSWSGVHGL